MMVFLQSAIVHVAPFVAVISLIVTVHELGHFLTAKAFGVAIDRFSIGFGRAIVSWRDRAGVEWRIGWLPLGGYVKFSGDENVASVPDQAVLDDLRRDIVDREGPGSERRYLPFKPLWQRALIVFGGKGWRRCQRKYRQQRQGHHKDQAQILHRMVASSLYGPDSLSEAAILILVEPQH